MTLSVRAVALQGLGFSTRLIAVQGFGAIAEVTPDLPYEFPPGDDDREVRIRQQNRALITLLMGFAASGAIQ